MAFRSIKKDVAQKNQKPGRPKRPPIPVEVLGQYMRMETDPKSLSKRAYKFWKEKFKDLQREKKKDTLEDFLSWSLKGYVSKVERTPKLWYVDNLDMYHDAFEAWRVRPDMDKYLKRQERWKDKDFDYHSWALYKPSQFFIRNANLETTNFDHFLKKKMYPNRKVVRSHIGDSIPRAIRPPVVRYYPYGHKMLELT